MGKRFERKKSVVLVKLSRFPRATLTNLSRFYVFSDDAISVHLACDF